MVKQSVLASISALLDFKDHTTISEVAHYSGHHKAHVLEVINRNADCVARDRRTGRITGIKINGWVEECKRAGA